MTYSEAKQNATSQNPNVIYMGDAGNGWGFEVYFCPMRNRQVWTSVSPDGMRVV